MAVAWPPCATGSGAVAGGRSKEAPGQAPPEALRRPQASDANFPQPPAVCQARAQRCHQAGDVTLPAAIGKHDGLTARQTGQGRGQIRFAWHQRATDQQGDDLLAGSERRGDLLAYEIGRIVQAPRAVDPGLQPTRADQHQHRIDAAQLAVDGLLKILARPDIVNIPEYAASAELGLQPIGQAASEPGTVLAAIGQKNAAHGPSPGADQL